MSTSVATITHEVWTVRTSKGESTTEFVVHGLADLHLAVMNAAAQNVERFSFEVCRPGSQIELVIR